MPGRPLWPGVRTLPKLWQRDVQRRPGRQRDVPVQCRMGPCQHWQLHRVRKRILWAQLPAMLQLHWPRHVQRRPRRKRRVRVWRRLRRVTDVQQLHPRLLCVQQHNLWRRVRVWHLQRLLRRLRWSITDPVHGLLHVVQPHCKQHLRVLQQLPQLCGIVLDVHRSGHQPVPQLHERAALPVGQLRCRVFKWLLPRGQRVLAMPEPLRQVQQHQYLVHRLREWALAGHGCPLVRDRVPVRLIQQRHSVRALRRDVRRVHGGRLRSVCSVCERSSAVWRAVQRGVPLWILRNGVRDVRYVHCPVRDLYRCLFECVRLVH